jgi:hypothetical protein
VTRETEDDCVTQLERFLGTRRLFVTTRCVVQRAEVGLCRERSGFAVVWQINLARDPNDLAHWVSDDAQLDSAGKGGR